mgnify:CR=1 FL=1
METETESRRVFALLKSRAAILCSKRSSQRSKDEKNKCRRLGDAIKKIIDGKDGRFRRQVKHLIRESTVTTPEAKAIMKSDIDGFMTRASASTESSASSDSLASISRMLDSKLKYDDFIKNYNSSRSRSSSPKPSRYEKLMADARLEDNDTDNRKVFESLKSRATILCTKRNSQRTKDEKNTCRRHGDRIKTIVNKSHFSLTRVKRLIQDSTTTSEIKAVMTSDIDGFIIESVEDRDKRLLKKILDVSEGRPLHLHGSPPCTTASRASNDKIDRIIDGCRKCTKDLLCDQHDSSGRSVEWFLNFVEKVRSIKGADFTWSIEEAGLDLYSNIQGKTRAKQLLKLSREKESLGYPQYVVLDAASCGVPSRRERLVGGVGFDLMNMLHTLGSQADFCNKSNFLDVLKMCGINTMPKDANGIFANKQATWVKSTEGVGGELKGQEAEYHMTDMAHKYYAKEVDYQHYEKKDGEKDQYYAKKDGKRLWPFTQGIKTMLEARKEGYMAKDYKESKANDQQLISDCKKCKQHEAANPVIMKDSESEVLKSLKCSTKNNKGYTCEIVEFEGKPSILPIKVRKNDDDWSKPYAKSQKIQAVSSRVAAFDQILRSATIMLFPKWVRVFQTPVVIDGSLNTKIGTGEYEKNSKGEYVLNSKGERKEKMKNATVNAEFWVNCRLMRYLNAREGKAMLGFPNDFVASCEKNETKDCVREDEEKEDSEVTRRCIGDSVSPAVSFCMFATSKMGDLQRSFKQPSGSRSLSPARSDREGTVTTVANLQTVFDIAETLGGRRSMQDVSLMLNRTFTHWNDLDESISKRITAKWFRSQLEENSEFSLYMQSDETKIGRGGVSLKSSQKYRKKLETKVNQKGKKDRMEEILEQIKRVILGLPTTVTWEKYGDHNELRTAYNRFMEFVQNIVTKQFFPVTNSAAHERLKMKGFLTEDGKVDKKKVNARYLIIHPDKHKDYRSEIAQKYLSEFHELSADVKSALASESQ